MQRGERRRTPSKKMAEATEAAAANARPGPRGRESGPAGAAKLASAKKAARRVRAKAAAEAAAEVEAAEAAAQQIAADNVEGAVERAAGPAISLPMRAARPRAWLCPVVPWLCPFKTYPRTLLAPFPILM